MGSRRFRVAIGLKLHDGQERGAIRVQPSVAPPDIGVVIPPAAAPGRWGLLRRHWLFTGVLLLAAVLRLVFWLELHPALMFADSWIYLNDVRPFNYLMYRPAGYVFILSALRAEHHLELVTALQHIAGLITGVFIYVMCLRRGLSRNLAVVPAALFLFNALTLVLEQYLLTEAFFALLVFSSMWLAVEHPDRPGPLAASGILLGLAAILRGAGMFAVPFWLLWLVYKNYRKPGVVVVPLLALLLPVAGYVANRNAATDYGSYSIIRGEGWFLYGRAMSFADCANLELDREVAPLCPADKPEEIPEWYVWAPESPARTFYQDDDPAHNEEVRGVALSIIRQQPVDYLKAVANDLAQAFIPGGRGDDDASVVLAYEGEEYPFDIGWPAAANIVAKYKLDYEFPKVSRDSFLAYYWRFGKLPRLLTGIAALLVLAVGVRGRWRRDERAQAAVFYASTGLGMLAAAVATHTFGIRYVVPVVPLVASAGALAFGVIWEDLRARISTRTHAASQ